MRHKKKRERNIGGEGLLLNRVRRGAARKSDAFKTLKLVHYLRQVFQLQSQFF